MKINIIVLFLNIVFVLPVYVQTPQQQHDWLMQFASERQWQWQIKRSEAESIAIRLNMPVNKKLSNGVSIELQRFERGRPIYYKTNNLIDQKRCRAWRACVSACPYKKSFYNWSTGKSEKCILCYPRLETGQAPACFHSCVGRIRYLGVLLYDADKIEEVAKSSNEDLIDAQRAMILNPNDPAVIVAALENGIHESVIDSAQQSPVYKFVKEWKIALPPHIEFRTLPMLFYVPPMSPVMAQKNDDTVSSVSKDFFHDIEQARVPLQFLGNLFGAGHQGKVVYALKKQKAVRMYRRAVTVGDIDMKTAEKILTEAECSKEEAEMIYRLTSLCTFEDRFVIPPMHREEAIEMLKDPHEHRTSVGFGFVEGPERGL